ncbi:phosphotriesterase-related protein [Vibrio sp. VB16]|uniref:phosphotriesterase family protein n=1 Tax=Vibrio sp. VB16 TaxID=2785746 RepID=UPI00189ED371|nr:phosphotriesterase-related protein [Vibrio sp. VB16]UGA54416.1 phosphotriesterase-related protein [Vibrio sp. VB16]
MPDNSNGFTYCHEHLHIDLSVQKQDIDCKLDQYEPIKQELLELKKIGVCNIIEVTNFFMGRNPHFIEGLIKDTGMNILMSTGYYMEGFFPEYLDSMSVEDIAQTMIAEIESGIEGSSLKASLIGEIGSSKDVFTKTEQKVFKAAAIAHLQTGCPISTHTSFSTMGRQQATLLRENGVNLSNVTIGHCDLRDNFDDLIWLLEQGCYVQIDTIGKNSYYPDSKRVEVIVGLINRGYVKQLMLSMDITRRSHLKANDGLGFAYLIESFVPKLLDQGISEVQIEMMLKNNPARFFKIK